jgi:hypothetical protein
MYVSLRLYRCYEVYVVHQTWYQTFIVLFLAGILTPDLQNFLELNLPKVKAGKKPKFSVGVAEPKLGSAILEATHLPCQSNDFVNEFLRGIRFHFSRFIKDLKVSFQFILLALLLCGVAKSCVVFLPPHSSPCMFLWYSTLIAFSGWRFGKGTARSWTQLQSQ